MVIIKFYTRSDVMMCRIWWGYQRDEQRGCLRKRATKTTSKTTITDGVCNAFIMNEWGEGSYLEPDTVHGMEYLEAVRMSSARISQNRN